MPFLTPGKWELNKFVNYQKSIPNTIIPLYDLDVYHHFQQQHWLFNRLYICESLGYLCAPHGIVPQTFPVFSRPIYNIDCDYFDCDIWKSIDDVKFKPGYFWFSHFNGDYIRTDTLILNNEILWSASVKATLNEDGRFMMWETLPNLSIKNFPSIINFVERKVYRSYYGAMSFNTINGNIIDVQSRITTQFLDFYPNKIYDALIKLYRDMNDKPARLLKIAYKGYSKNFWSKHPNLFLDIGDIMYNTKDSINKNYKMKWYRVGYTNEILNIS
jgi:hypothetical protein